MHPCKTSVEMVIMNNQIVISLFWLVIHAHGIKGHGQVDIFTIKQTLLDEVNAGKILPNPTLKLNHSSQNCWIWMLFHFFAYQDSSTRLFAEPTCLSLSNQDLHVTAFRAINDIVLPAFTTGSGQLSQPFSELRRLNGDHSTTS